MDELKFWLSLCERAYLSEGSQGRCYKIGNKVYKIFLQYIEEDDDEITPYFKEDILRFSDVVNSTYIFPKDVILVGDVVVGYITDYVDAIPLYKTNPLNVDLDLFEKALIAAIPSIKKISKKGILSFDVMYNILYGINGLSVVDTLEYSKTDIDYESLFNINYDRFCNEIKLFLIYGYFDKIVSSNKKLFEMYNDKGASIVLFLREFKKSLSETEGYEIKFLSEAKRSMVIRTRKIPSYIREI